ncbi:hypothetical protein RJ639_045624 [Escallonia herrerae]|uniref:Uncharacterized protein n=1 Tax=Escallonia herrerae TaxID=1293975 RepID=A0AA89AZI6_9ASTE|nr:hypothetical protein RJ639_045624 [Escallonia herrerae]
MTNEIFRRKWVQQHAYDYHCKSRLHGATIQGAPSKMQQHNEVRTAMNGDLHFPLPTSSNVYIKEPDNIYSANYDSVKYHPKNEP